MRGDMSLIGPRPRAAAEFGAYFAQASECLLASFIHRGLWCNSVAATKKPLDWRDSGVRSRSVRVSCKSPRHHAANYAALPSLSPVAGKPITATFDAGLDVLGAAAWRSFLREIALRLGLVDIIAMPLRDERDPHASIHTYAEGTR